MKSWQQQTPAKKVDRRKQSLASKLQQPHDTALLLNHITTAAMVTKSKLKMALAADKGTDFAKQSLKKAAKQAAKQKKAKTGGVVIDGEQAVGKKGNKGKVAEEEWEDLDDEEEVADELVDGGVSMEEDGALTEDEEDVDGPQVHNPFSFCSRFTCAILTSYLDRLCRSRRIRQRLLGRRERPGQQRFRGIRRRRHPNVRLGRSR